MLARRELAAPLVHAEADYLAPLRFGDDVRVELVLAVLGASSTAYAYRIKKPDGQVAATGETRHVWVDGATFRPTALPAALRDFLRGKPGVSES
jgi:acyl-CoA thioesterase FadM